MEPPTHPTVLCLGNFDGVHRAHQALLARVHAMAAEMTARGNHASRGIFSFFSPSIDHIGHRPSPGHLTPLREKLGLFSAAGMDFACLCDFREVRHLSPDEFIRLLTDRAHCRGVVCGYDFRFGTGGLGNADTLVARFDRPAEGMMADVLPVMMQDGAPISSTRIRTLLATGQAEAAAVLLGRPYALDTTVVHGKHLGQKLGFPTANQYFPAESIIPARGVYATLCHTSVGVFPGVSNVGCHPTMDTHARVNCETHILGLSHDLYGQRIRVEFLKHLRPEQAFPDVDALITAIRWDVAETEAYFATYIPANK